MFNIIGGIREKKRMVLFFIKNMNNCLIIDYKMKKFKILEFFLM